MSRPGHKAGRLMQTLRLPQKPLEAMMNLTNLSERAWLRFYTSEIISPSWEDHARSYEPGQKQDYFFDEVIHLFFDDTHYGSQPEDHLGESLLDLEEVAAVRRMAGVLDNLLDAAPHSGMTDADWLRVPEWTAVHEAAKDLHALIVANDTRIAAA